ncbi:cytochrome P450 [Pseudalkalibacillus sp. R45]|uniref:cytochrome P450 n=1 Tax=Pseudalkalibacillus sp. R45 TaxID=3457433 RepID=UPI003FCDE6AA
MNETVAMREQFQSDPYLYFEQYRKYGPIHYDQFFGIPKIVVTGFEETEALFKDSRFIKEYRRVVPPEQRVEIPERVQPVIYLMNNMMLFRDAPDHTRLRKLVTKAFTPRMVDKLRPLIEELADELLNSRKGEKEHELIRDFSYYLPVVVIAELIGVPKEDRGYFRKWADAFVTFIDFNTDMNELETVSDDIKDSGEYFQSLIQKRSTEPQDDLISGLIAVEESGDVLNEDEMVATCLLLMIAGHETTVNLITNGYYTLLKHPEQLKLLQNDLSLIPNAIEEILRFEPPVLMTSRIVAEDLEFYGKQFKKAEEVMLVLGAANRDPRLYDNPHEFDITRKNIKHLSFASGPHFCLGSPLARLEAQIALEKLVTRFKEPLLSEEPQWRDNIVFRGFKALQLKGEIK